MTGKEKSGKQEGIEKVATEGEGRRWGSVDESKGGRKGSSN